MSGTPDHFDFSTDAFGHPTDFPDEAVQFDPTEDDIHFAARDLGATGAGDLQATITLPEQSADETATDVEAELCDLLATGHRTALLVLAGERPDVTASVPSELVRSFSGRYAKAVRANPALRWYAKLAAILPEDRFTLQAGQLRVAMPTSLFKKTLQPFLTDFEPRWASASPMVAAVLNLARAARTAQAKVSVARQGPQARSTHAAEQTDLNLNRLAFGAAQVTDRAADLGLDTDGVETDEDTLAPDDGDMTTATMSATDTPPAAQPRLKLNLTDLSQKAIADYLHTLQDQTPEQLAEYLAQEGFPTNRANEILAMLRYKRVQAARRAAGFPPQGNRGLAAEFTFR